MQVKNKIDSIDIFFILLIIINISLSWILIHDIPYSFPFGGPDELMHRSIAKYIATHLEWPNWDSKEILRNAYGVSYSAGGSIVYWLHGITYKLFGMHRVGAFILLLVYLLIATLFYRKNRVAGFLLLAALFPQTLFIFSYVNSDSGTLISALLLGISAGIFLVGESRIKNFFLFFFFAGFAVTARQHLWAIAFITFLWVLFYKRKVLFSYDKRIWIIALVIALIPASWWLITSYLANDGDILGIFTTSKSIAKFGQEGLPLLARDWNNISIMNFLTSTLISLYADWGWIYFPLSTIEYLLVGSLFILTSVMFIKYIDKKILLFLLILIIINFGFMLVYSTFYDYQAQGRYLFPSIYIAVGILASIFFIKNIFSKKLLRLLVIFSIVNIYFATKLTFTYYNENFIKKPVPWENASYTLSTETAFHIDDSGIIDNRYSIRGWVFDKKSMHPFIRLYLVMKSTNNIYRVPLEQISRPDVAKAFHHKELEKSGFYDKVILLKNLPKGKYSLLLGGELNNHLYLIDIHKKIER